MITPPKDDRSAARKKLDKSAVVANHRKCRYVRRWNFIIGTFLYWNHYRPILGYSRPRILMAARAINLRFLILQESIDVSSRSHGEEVMKPDRK